MKQLVDISRHEPSWEQVQLEQDRRPFSPLSLRPWVHPLSHRCSGPGSWTRDETRPQPEEVLDGPVGKNISNPHIKRNSTPMHRKHNLERGKTLDRVFSNSHRDDRSGCRLADCRDIHHCFAFREAGDRFGDVLVAHIVRRFQQISPA